MNKTRVFDGGAISPFWWHDGETAYHNRFSVALDHPVDQDSLAAAWAETKRIYPMLDWIPALENGRLVFYEGADNSPLHSEQPVSPGSEACGGSAFALCRFGNRLSLGAYHSVVDGGGLKAVFSTLVWLYLARQTGERDEDPPVELRTGRAPESIYMPLSSLPTGTFRPQPPVTYRRRKGMFIDPDMAPDGEGNLFMARLRFSADSFMQACRRIGANPSSMLVILMARAAYQLHPDRKGDLAFVLTASAREAFHVQDTIANFSFNYLIPTEYEKIMSEDLRPAAGEIRSLIARQREEDFMKTMIRFYETYDWILAKRYAILTYMGRLDIGRNTSHIRSFEMTDDAAGSLYLMELNGEFVLSLQLGAATGKYFSCLREILSGFGVPAAVELPVTTVPRDVKTPV